MGPPGAGTFYLTNAIGPGTTVANEIASTSFSGIIGLATSHPFSGLTLGPGTYYLVLGNLNPGSGWQVVRSPVTTTGSGVTRNNDQVAIGGAAAYPPASTFASIPQGSGPNDSALSYQVTGDAAVPEPAAVWFVAIGFMMCLIRKTHQGDRTTSSRPASRPER